LFGFRKIGDLDARLLDLKFTITITVGLRLAYRAAAAAGGGAAAAIGLRYG
jgi:hypothetical protein